MQVAMVISAFEPGAMIAREIEMGFNFQAGHPCDVLGSKEGERVAGLLRERFVRSVPLGTPGEAFCLQDELGWSWWSRLRDLAVEKLGASGSAQISAVDAWSGVYLDTDVTRDVLWPDGMPDRDVPAGRQAFMLSADLKVSPLTRVLGWLGIRRRPARPPEAVQGAMRQMVEDYGNRAGEEDGMQIGNLRVLMDELGALLDVLGIDRAESAVDALRRSYVESDERVEADPEIQCLCHVWLTASYAMAHRAPLWLLK